MTLTVPPTYGLDADLKAKQLAAHDPELEREVCEWIEAVSGDAKGEQTMAAWLHDGKVLCKLANAIQPGAVKKVNESAMVFKQRENITYFQKFAREIGVPESAMFGTDDLFDEKNMNSVTSMLNTFGGAVQTHFPGFAGPKLGVPLSTASKDVKRASGVATQMGGLAGVMEVHAATTTARQVAGGANPNVTAPPEAGADAAGLDRDLAEKKAAKFDADLEKAVCDWIEAVTGDAKGDRSTSEWLKSGVVLCELANKHRPGCIPAVNTMNTPFKHRENITFFQKAARDLGVPETSMFGTDDLYEEKDMGTFVVSMGAFGGAVQLSCNDFQGPKLGVGVMHQMDDRKRHSGLCVDQTEAMQRTMEVERPRDNVGVMAKVVQ